MTNTCSDFHNKIRLRHGDNQTSEYNSTFKELITEQSGQECKIPVLRTNSEKIM